MSTLRDAMSHAALGWVKPELDEILRLVRNEVEYFAEEPTDTGRMRACAGYLHQVQGTLRMVELYAPALVAEELEHLASAIGAGSAPDRDEACATLMRGSVLLPDYLERLQNGHRDIPIVLLPLLNDIRAARGEAGINERVLFAFAPESETASEAEVDHARGSISGRNRELLDTVGSAVKEELLRIKDALDLHLRTGSAPAQLQQQVDELGAVADTLAMMGLGVARGVVQQQRDALQSVVAGEHQIDEDMLLDIAGALLYVDASLDDQVAHLGAIGSGEDDPSAAETRRTVEVLAHEAIANFTAARERFVAFIETGWQHAELQDVPRLMGEVSGALRMLDLGTAADYLQGVKQYVAAELLERQRVPSGRQLDTLADAMASLEYYLEALRDRRPGREDILEITRSSLESLRYWPLPVAGATLAIAEAGTGDAIPVAPAPTDDAPQPVAREAVAMPALQIEPVAPAPTPMEAPVLPPPLPWQVAFDEAPAAADAAVPVQVAATDGLPEYGDASDTPVDPPAGDTVPAPLLFGASSAQPPEAPLWELGVSGQMPSAEAAQTTTFTGFDPVDAELHALAVRAPGAWQVDASLPGHEAGEHATESSPLPDDEGSLSYHVDVSGFDPVLAEFEPMPEAAAPVAYHLHDGALANAGDVLSLDADEASSVAFPQDIAAFDASAASATAAAPVDDAHARFMAELDAAAAAFEPLPDAAPAAEAQAGQVTVGASSEPAQNEAAPTATVGDAGFDPEAENIDQDIREVFLEEFEEELGNLGTLLPAWRAQLDSVDRLRPIRRVFHTLKGSGRLVGARTLGEFAWKIEGMLNRVLDGTRAATPAVVAVVDEAVQVLPQLLAALRDGTPVWADLQGLQAVADRVAAGEETFHVPLPTAVAEAVDVPPGDEVEGTPASIDSVLLEILEAEVDAHLATLRGWLALPHPQPVTDPLLRAMHTMNGAFAMTDVPEITAATTGAESYIKRALAADQLPTPDALDALQATAMAIGATMAALQAQAPRIPSQAVLAERLQALAATLPEARWPALVDDADAAGEPWQDHTEAEVTHVGEPQGDVEPIDSMPSESMPSDGLQIDGLKTDAVHDSADAVAEGALVEDTPVAHAQEDESAATDTVAAEALDFDSDAGTAHVDEAFVEPAQVERAPSFAPTADEPAADEPAGTGRQADEPHAVAPDAVQWPIEADAPDTARETVQVDDALAVADTQHDVPLIDPPHVDASHAWAFERADVEDLGLSVETPPQALSDTRADAEDLSTVHAFEATLDDGASDGLEAQEDAPQVPAFGEAVTLEQALDEGLHVIEAEAEPDHAPVDGEHEAEAHDAEAHEAEVQETEAADATSSAHDQPAEQRTALDPLFEMEPVLPALSAAGEVVASAAADEETPSDALDFSVLDRELVDIFVEEGKDLMDHCDGLISELRAAPDDRDVLAGLQRDLHTLKGGARMAGINAIGDLGHDIESLLETVAAGRTQLERSDVQLLERGFDRLHQLLTRTGQHRQVQPADDLLAAFQARTAQQPALVDDAPQDEVDAEIARQPLSAPVPMEAGGDDDGNQPRPQQEQVRVRADLLDRLVNHAGELAIYRSRLEQQLGAFRGAMGELERTNARLRDQLRRLDLETEAQIVARYQREQDQAHTSFDPLELDRFSTLQQLSRALNESAADLGGLQGVLDDLSRQYDGLLQQQSRVSSELQDGLMRARMVPFDGLVPRLRRVVRQAGVDTGKQVHLTLEGTHGELDRNVLDRMIAPLEHMLRNSVAHGLETPEQRRAAGKPEEGEIALRLHREGSEIVLEVADDGAGLDREAIRRRALERGLLDAGSTLEDHELDNLIFSSGFSTADQVSQLAGRGVGMDVVRNEVRQLGGSVDIHSVRGQGVRFTLRLPQTLAVTQAVFVQIGETAFAVPVASVSGIGRISRQRFEAGETTYRYGGEAYTLYDLGTLVGQSPARAEGQAQVPLLLVRAGDLRAAVAIDQVLGNREIVVKPVGLQIASVPGIYGATITGDGRVVVILDVAPLVRRFVANPQRPVQVTAQPQQRQVPLVMVVDDSLTMRKVTGRILERHNFEVSVARDGVEALERLEERVPDLMLLDIEMPRMDGYELATAMRADPRYRDVPIVMITSRSGEKHRQRAFEIGVQRYLGKPYQELDLMRNVYDLLGIARVRE
ncbi:Hpt domain-containing protein [Xanthomonas sp. 60]